MAITFLFHGYRTTLLDTDKQRYKEINKGAKKEVAEAKETAWKLWSEDLDTAAGQQKVFKMANQMRKDNKDVLGSNFIRDQDGNVKVDSAEVLDEWRLEMLFRGSP